MSTALPATRSTGSGRRGHGVTAKFQVDQLALEVSAELNVSWLLPQMRPEVPVVIDGSGVAEA